LPSRVKTKVNKLNSLGINWRHKLGQGIGLLFRLNIMASKEYYFTIMVQRLLIDMLFLTAPTVLQRCKINHRLGVSGKKKV
jgi:uncharacterized membrane protein (UPF0127 family)